jgi:hypothetical protein
LLNGAVSAGLVGDKMRSLRRATTAQKYEFAATARYAVG